MKASKESGKNKTDFRWVIKIILLSIFVSILFTFASAEALKNVGYFLAFLVLAVFILIGILFDMVGVAVTSADEKPFHSMASHREKGAAEALRLIKSADRVSSVCNDVVGDISGIISGTTSAIIVARAAADFSLNNLLAQLLISGLVAGLTIGGKALGKNFAINRSKKLVLFVGKILHFGTGVKKKMKK